MKFLTAICIFLFSSLSIATPFQHIVVFGDSLSDNGNLYEYLQHRKPPSPPYYNGRFSNGPVWVEYLAELYFPGNPDTRLEDYAYGGAGIPGKGLEVSKHAITLEFEIDSYLQSHQNKAAEDSLFIVWIGANNYIFAPPLEVHEVVATVKAGIDSQVKRLAEAGAKHIMLINLPDLGRAPSAKETGSENLLTEYTRQHNEALSALYSALAAEYTEVHWYYFDAFSAFNEVLASPETFDFTNISDTCYQSANNTVSTHSVLQMVSHLKMHQDKEHCEGYLFFDPLHSTTQLHKILAEKVYKGLVNPDF